ncbi:short-chain dehydrogenase/reductase SDR [Arthrobacter crystallopoietes BAB-32]|uniref:Short-chain dehydrogenase/reductase SDR n=1 Tax=Arthrobacter crystallopoietes BAB-32 TaxID=1246476 RepID=N1V262_9MICC|nr:SDR family oxidoreductase [Arthrobacter crystallopoietes]EMY34167.1 short-chain dehydrogenase/reductase SDR [Arthrobacter crystallopoietes BAB-32]
MDTGLKGKNVLVPGSSSGIGLAIAQALAEEGANVVLAARREDVVQAEAAKLPSAIGVGLDLTDDQAPAALVEAAEKAFGPIDVLVLNGGGPPPGGAAEVTDEQVLAATHQLLLQHIRLTNLVLPGMRERGWGRIVAVGSSGVQQPLANLALSNIGRAGLAGYLKTLAAEVAADGVTVNMVLPGRIDTDRVASLDAAAAKRTGRTPEEARRSSEAGIPAGRYGKPEEFAAVVAFLAGVPAAYVTGEQIRVDGGMVRSY